MKLTYAMLKKKRVARTSLGVWAKWFGVADRGVNLTKIGGYTVTTVFLGIDHGTPNNPLWFETAVIAAPKTKDDMIRVVARYRTWRQAVDGHAKVVKALSETQ